MPIKEAWKYSVFKPIKEASKITRTKFKQFLKNYYDMSY